MAQKDSQDGVDFDVCQKMHFDQFFVELVKET